MRINISCLVLSALYFVFISAPLAQSDQPGTVLALRGSSSLLREGETEWRTIRVEDKVYRGDRVKTGHGAMVKIMFAGGVLLILDEDTTARIDEYLYSPAKASRIGRINLIIGRVRAIVESLKLRQSDISISTTSAVAGVKGTDMVVDQRREGVTGVFILDGIVDVRNIDPAVKGVQMVKAGYFCEVFRGQPPTVPRVMTREQIDQLIDGLWIMQDLKSRLSPEAGEKPLSRDRGIAAIPSAASIAGATRPGLEEGRQDPQLGVAADEFIYPRDIVAGVPPPETAQRGPTSPSSAQPAASQVQPEQGRPPSPPRDMGPEFFGGGR